MSETHAGDEPVAEEVEPQAGGAPRLTDFEQWVAESPLYSFILVSFVLGVISRFHRVFWIEKWLGDPEGSWWIPYQWFAGVSLFCLGSVLLVRGWRRRRVSRALFWIFLLFGISALDGSVRHIGSVIAWEHHHADWPHPRTTVESMTLGLPPGSTPAEIRTTAKAAGIELEPQRSAAAMESVFGSRSTETRFLYRRFSIEDEFWFLVSSRESLHRISRFRSSGPNNFAGLGSSETSAESDRWTGQ